MLRLAMLLTVMVLITLITVMVLITLITVLPVITPITHVLHNEITAGGW